MEKSVNVDEDEIEKEIINYIEDMINQKLDIYKNKNKI